MKRHLHERLTRHTSELRTILGETATEELARTIAQWFLTWDTSKRRGRVKLHSPQRQLAFALGLLLTTEEPDQSTSLDDERWQRCQTLLNSIVDDYAEMFWPEEWGPEQSEKIDRAHIAMLAFLEYFNSGILASADQIKERIESCLCPFDAELESIWGVSASTALLIADNISSRLQARVDRAMEKAHEEASARHRLLDQAMSEGWDMERLRREAEDSGLLDQLTQVFQDMGNLFTVTLDEISSSFGADLATAFWDQFTSRRGDQEDFFYFTQANPVDLAPIVEIGPRQGVCPLANRLYESILLSGETDLAGSVFRDRLFRNRDRALEEQTRQELEIFFGPVAESFDQVFETSDLQFEHDLIVVWHRSLLLVEIKASPPPEPFRDPEKAFVRIERAFRSETGIQKGFDQSVRLERRLRSGEDVELFDRSRKPVSVLKSEDFDDVFSVCVTRDNFGALATDLTLLLQKNQADPYPWAINILDLQNLLVGWRHFSWGPAQLLRYLRARVQLHGRVFGADELDFAGFFVQHGGLEPLLNAVGMVVLEPHYSEVFDEIYYAERLGEQVTVSTTRPRWNYVQAPLNPVPSDPRELATPRRWGRNKPCYCGSGKKHKFCHGRE